MSDAAIDDIVALLPPLLQSIDALAFVARHLNPADYAAVLDAVGAPDEALAAARSRLGAWPEKLAHVRARLEAASDEALAGFAGVNRRFTKVGEVGGVAIIDDYGHHPVEIAAVLKAARQAVSGMPGARVIAVHQPHRYTRLSSLFNDFCGCFNEADVVAIAEVYAAGEDPIPGASRDDLVSGLIAHGHRHARAILDEADLARLFREQARPGDIFVCLGAGTISAWANALPAKLIGQAA